MNDYLIYPDDHDDEDIYYTGRKRVTADYIENCIVHCYDFAGVMKHFLSPDEFREILIWIADGGCRVEEYENRLNTYFFSHVDGQIESMAALLSDRRVADEESFNALKKRWEESISLLENIGVPKASLLFMVSDLIYLAPTELQRRITQAGTEKTRIILQTFWDYNERMGLKNLLEILSSKHPCDRADELCGTAYFPWDAKDD